jgi:hypothetical protein
VLSPILSVERHATEAFLSCTPCILSWAVHTPNCGQPAGVCLHLLVAPREYRASYNGTGFSFVIISTSRKEVVTSLLLDGAFGVVHEHMDAESELESGKEV